MSYKSTTQLVKFDMKRYKCNIRAYFKLQYLKQKVNRILYCSRQLTKNVKHNLLGD